MPRKTAVAAPVEEPENDPEPSKETQDNPNFWVLLLCDPWEGHTRMEYFYDGALATRDGVCLVPKDHAHWASRLVRFENYRFAGYQRGEFPMDFVEAVGGV